MFPLEGTFDKAVSYGACDRHGRVRISLLVLLLVMGILGAMVGLVGSAWRRHYSRHIQTAELATWTRDFVSSGGDIFIKTRGANLSSDYGTGTDSSDLFAIAERKLVLAKYLNAESAHSSLGAELDKSLEAKGAERIFKKVIAKPDDGSPTDQIVTRWYFRVQNASGEMQLTIVPSGKQGELGEASVTLRVKLDGSH